MTVRAFASYFELLIRDFQKGVLDLVVKARQAVNQEEDIDFTPEELETIYAIGYNYFTIGDTKDSKEIFTMLTEISPETDFYWRALGAVNQQIKEYEDAISAYETAIDRNSFDIVSKVYLCECLLLSNKHEEAISRLEDIVKSDGFFGSPWIQRAQFLLDEQRTKKEEIQDDG